MTDALRESQAGEPERIAEIRVRLNTATPGPWALWEDSSEVCTVRANGQIISGVVASVRVKWVHEAQRFEQAANARLIANAPDDIAWLLSTLARLTEERDQLQSELASWRQVARNEKAEVERLTEGRAAATTCTPASDGERVKPTPSDKNDREALGWLKSQHAAPCGDGKCDSAYCYIADRLIGLLSDRAELVKRNELLETALADRDASEPLGDVGDRPTWGFYPRLEAAERAIKDRDARIEALERATTGEAVAWAVQLVDGTKTHASTDEEDVRRYSKWLDAGLKEANRTTVIPLYAPSPQVAALTEGLLAPQCKALFEQHGAMLDVALSYLVALPDESLRRGDLCGIEEITDAETLRNDARAARDKLRAVQALDGMAYL